MRDVWIRNRPDGITELSPQLSQVESGERWLVIFTFVMATCGFFVAGAMPAEVLAVLVACCVAGEVVLGAKAALLVLLRPLAQVHEVPRWRLPRRLR
jgi:hypothetical protein